MRQARGLAAYCADNMTNCVTTVRTGLGDLSIHSELKLPYLSKSLTDYGLAIQSDANEVKLGPLALLR